MGPAGFVAKSPQRKAPPEKAICPRTAKSGQSRIRTAGTVADTHRRHPPALGHQLAKRHGAIQRADRIMPHNGDASPIDGKGIPLALLRNVKRKPLGQLAGELRSPDGNKDAIGEFLSRIDAGGPRQRQFRRADLALADIVADDGHPRRLDEALAPDAFTRERLQRGPRETRARRQHQSSAEQRKTCKSFSFCKHFLLLFTVYFL